jgi:hypothetical protein
VLVAERHEVRIRQRADVHVPDPHRPPVALVESAEHVEERALPHARCPDDRDHFPALDRQIEPPEHRQRAVADDVALVEVADFDKGRH